jgi:hypothetical protein
MNPNKSSWKHQPKGFDSPAVKALEKATNAIKLAMGKRVESLLEEAQRELRKHNK